MTLLSSIFNGSKPFKVVWSLAVRPIPMSLNVVSVTGSMANLSPRSSTGVVLSISDTKSGLVRPSHSPVVNSYSC